MYRNNPDDIEIRVRRLEQCLHNSMSMAEMTHRLERLGKDVEECDRKHQLKSYFDSCAADSRKALEQRLERLGNSVDELFGYRNSFIADHQEAGSRIEKMEKALSEEMAKTREMDGILAGVVRDVERLKHYSPVKWSEMNVRDDGSIVPPKPDPELKFTTSGPCHTICIMPNGSPSGIPFSVALEYLKAGRTILAPGGTRYIMQDGQVRQTDGTIHTRVFIGGELLLSSQWMVLPEKPQNP